MKKIIATAVALLGAGCIGLTACGAFEGGAPDYGWNYPNAIVPDGSAGAGDNYEYTPIIESDFQSVKDNNASYFSLDRNTACYSLVRRQIENGYDINPSSVRIEELINYFDYSYPAPENDAVSVTGYLADCPWNANSKLLLAGVKTCEYELEAENANYVFLIDVSGSMSGDDRLGLAKHGMEKLLESLGERDLVSIVTYANGVKTVLDATECTADGKTEILNKIKALSAYGGTNGGDGLQRAYNIAKTHYITGGNNRVILVSDGDFNVGMSDKDELKEFIQTQAESGVYLTVLGVGMGNTRDTILETLALAGNGNYAYLDSKKEAEKVLKEELNGTLKTVAKDAKAGVTFTENVEKYRLIGYDSKIISEDDFNNSNADTGEIGSNLCVSALYEIVLAENADGKLADVEIRYKDVRGESGISKSASCEITALTTSCDDLSFISCVAEFGLLLRQSAYKGDASFEAVLTRLNGLADYIGNDYYKQEFVTLAGKASEKY